MNLICGDCATARIKRQNSILVENQFNDDGRIEATIGNARKPFICFDCGIKYGPHTACAAIFATGEDFQAAVIPADNLNEQRRSENER